MHPLAPVLEPLVTAVVVALPLVLAIGLGVWTRRLAGAGKVGSRWHAYLPLAFAAAAGLAGVAVAASASSGLEGLGAVLIGAYLIGIGGLGVTACVVALVLATRDVSRGRRRPVRG